MQPRGQCLGTAPGAEKGGGTLRAGRGEAGCPGITCTRAARVAAWAMVATEKVAEVPSPCRLRVQEERGAEEEPWGFSSRAGG